MAGSTSGAGLERLETREMAIERTFTGFRDLLRIAQTRPGVAPQIATMPTDDLARLKVRLRDRLPADSEGRVTYGARADAIKGTRPA